MSKYQDTEYNRLVRLKGVAIDLFIYAKSFRPDCTTFLRWRKEKLFENPDYLKGPSPTRYYLEGMYDTLWDMLYRYELEARSFYKGEWWRHDDLDAFAKTPEGQEFSYSHCGSCAHFWKSKPGDEKLYPWSDLNEEYAPPLVEEISNEAN